MNALVYVDIPLFPEECTSTICKMMTTAFMHKTKTLPIKILNNKEIPKLLYSWTREQTCCLVEGDITKPFTQSRNNIIQLGT